MRYSLTNTRVVKVAFFFGAGLDEFPRGLLFL
jgi:hypothetical protein